MLSGPDRLALRWAVAASQSPAGYRAGYEDPSYFSREHKRHFGEPPIRDIERLRTTRPTGVERVHGGSSPPEVSRPSKTSVLVRLPSGKATLAGRLRILLPYIA